MRIPSQLDFFYPSTSQLANYVEDIYTKLQNITEEAMPCILSGANVTTQDNKTFSCSQGSFRFLNANINGQLLPIFGISEPSNMSIPSNSTGYIVARYSVADVSPNLPTYLFPVQYIFVKTVDQNTDVAIAYLVDGQIQFNSALVNRYINSATNLMDAKNGISNNAALTPQILSQTFANQSKQFIPQGFGYYNSPGYAAGFYSNPSDNPCRKLITIYGHFNVSSVDPQGYQPIVLDSQIPTLTDTILVANVQGVCAVKPMIGSAYQTGLYTDKASYSKNGFVLQPIQLATSNATYMYKGSYTILAYSPL